MTKKCTTCGIEKDLGAFGLNRLTPDGRLNQCRLCRKAKRRVEQGKPGREIFDPTREKFSGKVWYK